MGGVVHNLRVIGDARTAMPGCRVNRVVEII
jgi:hypothetical protein